MTDTFITTVQIVLVAATAWPLARALRGPTLADRIVAVDLVLLLLTGAIAIEGGREGAQTYVPLLIVTALIAFAGTVLVARFIESRDTQ